MPFDIEFFEERAAIREYLGGFERAEAERLAVADVREATQPCRCDPLEVQDDA